MNRPRDYAEEEWVRCRDCDAVFPACDTVFASLDHYGDDYDELCPFCGHGWLEDCEAPDNRREVSHVAAIFLVVVAVCVVAIVLSGCAEPVVNQGPREAAVAVRDCYDRGGRALYLADERGAYAIFCEESRD